ncbi:hypothetical protein DL96DRAFT_645283 [Flagelloscypha sp. PMI_526]|nr:hypothetical protein DL96DRAFT_645283 [Flagelloscypha sp. PMI_526]
MAPIRPHSKTRRGCKTCKKRKVKCDEGEPTCQNCTRRGVECVWTSSPSETKRKSYKLIPTLSLAPRQGSSSTTSVSPPSPHPAACFDMGNMELLHHWIHSASFSISEPTRHKHGALLLECCRVTIPRLAFDNQILMHALLGFSALHLDQAYRKVKVDERDTGYQLPGSADTDFRAVANYHRRHVDEELRARGYPTVLGEPGTTSPPPGSKIDVSVGMLIQSTTAFHFVVDWHTSLASLLAFIQSRHLVLTTLLPNVNELMMGPLAKTLQAEFSHFLGYQDALLDGSSTQEIPFPQTLLDIHNPDSGLPQPEELEDGAGETYRRSVLMLRYAQEVATVKGFPNRGVIFWVAIITEDYVSLLAKRCPRALLIFARWTQIYRNAQGIQGLSAEEDVEDLVQGVRDLLDEQWKPILDRTVSPEDEVSVPSPKLYATSKDAPLLTPTTPPGEVPVNGVGPDVTLWNKIDT